MQETRRDAPRRRRVEALYQIELRRVEARGKRDDDRAALEGGALALHVRDQLCRERGRVGEEDVTCPALVVGEEIAVPVAEIRHADLRGDVLCGNQPVRLVA